MLTSNCTYNIYYMYHTVIGSPAIEDRPLFLEFTIDQIKYSWSNFKTDCVCTKEILRITVFLSQKNINKG